MGEKLGANETAILGPTIATLPSETVVAIVFPVIVICTITVVLVYIFVKPNTLCSKRI